MIRFTAYNGFNSRLEEMSHNFCNAVKVLHDEEATGDE